MERRLLLATMLLATAGGCYEREVPASEINELLTDNTVRGRHVRDGYSFTRVYHADQTFEQTGERPGTGRWEFLGDQVCITWDSPYPKAGRQFCRTMYTDDKGEYWKILVKRNRDEVKIVEYTSFTGPNGEDRRIIPSAGVRWRRVWIGWRGVVALLLILVVLRTIQVRLTAHPERPESLRNRIRRRLFRLQAGSHSYKYSELWKLDAPELTDFLTACIAEKKWVEVCWLLKALVNRTDNKRAIAGLWRALQDHGDDVAQECLGALVNSNELFDSKTNLEATDGDVRFAYCMGRAHQAEAEKYQNSSEHAFESNKKLALQYFDHVREKGHTPPPDLAARPVPYRENALEFSNLPNYALLVGAAYEAMLYANFIPPVKKVSSSSYSGGG